ERSEGWAYNWISALFPDFARWLGDKGDELARNLQKSPESPGQGTAPAPPARLPPRGYLLHYLLDAVLPIGLAVLTVLRVVAGNSVWLREFWYDTGKNLFGEENAGGFMRGMTQLVVYGLPILGCFLFYARPLRFGLGLAAVLLVFGVREAAQEAEDWTPLRLKDGTVLYWDRQ